MLTRIILIVKIRQDALNLLPTDDLILNESARNIAVACYHGNLNTSVHIYMYLAWLGTKLKGRKPHYIQALSM